MILGIDTATKMCTVALCRDEKLLAEYSVNAGMTHSEGLLPQIDQLFKRTKTAKKDLALIAVSTGPGSFTGLRIGLATAEALGFGLGVPVMGVSTLRALAWRWPMVDYLVAPVLDAQKGNLYMAFYEWQGGFLREIAPPQIVSKEQFAEKAAVLGRKILLLGETDKLTVLADRFLVPPEHLRLPGAAAVAFLAAAEYQAAGKKITGLPALQYLRRSEAEELWEKKNENKKP